MQVTLSLRRLLRASNADLITVHYTKDLDEVTWSTVSKFSYNLDKVRTTVERVEENVPNNVWKICERKEFH